MEYGKDLKQLMDELSERKFVYPPPRTVNQPEPEFEAENEAECIEAKDVGDELEAIKKALK